MYISYSGLAFEISSICTSFYEVIPLVYGQRTPQVGFIAAVADSICAPIGKRGVIFVFLACFGRIITRSPTEEVNPTGVRVRDIDIIFANHIVLVSGKPQSGGRCLVQQVTFGE